MKKTLKILTMLLFAATITTMVSCSKEKTNENRIVGRWKCISEDGDLAVFSQGKVYEFTSDGTVKTGGTNLSYQINDNTLSINLVVTFSFQIEELTDTEMTLSAPDVLSGSHLGYAHLSKL